MSLTNLTEFKKEGYVCTKGVEMSDFESIVAELVEKRHDMIEKMVIGAMDKKLEKTELNIYCDFRNS